MKFDIKGDGAAVLGCALVVGAGVGLFGNCLGVFVRPVSQELGLSRGALTLYATISLVMSAVTLPIYTKLFQRYSIRRVMFICGIGCCTAPIIYSFSTELWQFYVGGFVNGLFINGITMLAASTLLSRRVQKRLSLAVGLAFAGMGPIAAIMLPVTRLVISKMGWRWGYRSISIAAACILFPTILFIIKEDVPTPQGEIPIKQRSESTSAHLIYRAPCFWLCALGLFLGNLINLALFNNSMAFLGDIGYSDGFSALTISLALLLMLGAKPLMGHALDRYGIGAGAFLLGGVLLFAAISALQAGRGKGYCVVLAVGLALSSTINSIPASCFAGQLFPREYYPQLLSRLTMASYFGSAVGTPLAAAVFDLTASYNIAWVACAIGSLGVAALLWGASRTRVK